MITRRLVWTLGVSQLIAWGTTYYLIALFGEAITAENGWSRTVVYGGFSAALVVMGLTSAAVGRAIDRHGGAPVMTAGSVFGAAGCVALALARDLPTYYGGWLLLGVSMRMTLYDAAFAALARIGGPAARRPISQVTLLGGLASTVLWPVGQGLIVLFGWRGALLCYAGMVLATVPLHLAIPSGRHRPAPAGSARHLPPRAGTARQRALAGTLYAVGVTLSTFLNSAMSAHMIAILSGLGLAAGTAVAIAALRGVGQALARGGEVLFGSRLDPLALGLLSAALLPPGFVAGLYAGGSVAAAIAFALFYGSGNGLATIVRGTQPLVLFDPAAYGALVGRLLSPSFYLSASAPVVVAFVIDRYGEAAALHLSTLVAVLVLACAAALWASFRPPSGAAPA